MEEGLILFEWQRDFLRMIKGEIFPSEEGDRVLWFRLHFQISPESLQSLFDIAIGENPNLTVISNCGGDVGTLVEGRTLLFNFTSLDNEEERTHPGFIREHDNLELDIKEINSLNYGVRGKPKIIALSFYNPSILSYENYRIIDINVKFEEVPER